MREKHKAARGRSKLAQSRIDYITYGNPVGVGKLLNDYGYEAPGTIPELPGAIRELIRMEGTKAITDLVKLHPDREVILKTANLLPASTTTPAPKQPEPIAENKKEEEREVKKESPVCESCTKKTKREDSYCGCQHSYNSYDSYDSFDESILDKIASMETAELMKRYETLRKSATANPSNKNLADETMLVWNEIRQRTNRAQAEKPNAKASESATGKTIPLSRQEGMLLFGITIALAVIIGIIAVNKKYEYVRV
jgi:hypothetical protein